MNSKIIRAFVLSAVIFLVGTFSASAYGSSPTVASFTASPQTVNYGYSTFLSWSIANGAGYNLYFVCPATGVSIKKDDGTVIPCNTKQSLSTAPSDSASLYINNFTGNSVVIPVKITPKDSSGTEYSAATETINLFVGTIPNPITDFSYATTTSDGSRTPITITWTGVEIGGANLQFDCKDGIKIYSTSPAITDVVACGKPVYVSDLPASGSASVYFVNTYDYMIDQTIRILPAISAGVYDATHSKSITINIQPKQAVVPSSITSFSSSQTLLASGQSIDFSWASTNTPGVNFQMSCGNSVLWSNVTSTTTIPLLCGVPGFKSSLSGTGTTTISFVNNSGALQTIPVSIYPQNADGTYDGTKSRVVTVKVLPPGYVDTTVIAQTPTTTVAPTGANAATGASGIKAVRTITFTLSLRLGSKNSQVSALQEFLKQDPTIYPEGLVTGYMGNASVAAIKRFQIKYGVAKPGDAGYGNVGPMTRAKLNSIQTF